MKTLHPLIVHFPIALLITSVLFAVLAVLIKNKREVFKDILLGNLLLGTIGAVAAIISGKFAEESLAHNTKIHEIMEVHETLGYILTSIFAIIVIWLILRRYKIQIKELIIMTSFLIIASGLLVYTAYLGGKMVYEEGAGVIPMEKIMNNQTHEHNHVESGEDSHTEHSH